MSRKAASLFGALALSSLALAVQTPAQASEAPRVQTVDNTTATKTEKKPDKPATYTIKAGDTLTGIADNHDQPYPDLLGRNKQFWDNPNLIHPGEKVKLTGTVHKAPAPKPLPQAPAKKTQPNKTAPTPTPSPNPAPSAPATGSPKAYARSVLSADQFACINSLFARESGWNVYATNPSSGAYGIPQALPGSKMASAGADWRTNGVTQVKWGISYLNSRYGSPCGGWNHFLSHNWY